MVYHCFGEPMLGATSKLDMKDPARKGQAGMKIEF
jgi:hypothetical protein